jgi:hypothetical protein
MLTNWKTTLAGVMGILSILVKVMNHNWQFGMEDVAAVTASIGLLTAKDKNVTGGTTAQYTPPGVEQEKKLDK